MQPALGATLPAPEKIRFSIGGSKELTVFRNHLSQPITVEWDVPVTDFAGKNPCSGEQDT